MGRCRRVEITISVMSKILGTAPLLSVRRRRSAGILLAQNRNRLSVEGQSSAPYRPIVAKLIDLFGPNWDFH